jgi:hypothetical protein
MVLVMARGKAGPQERRSKMLKGELESNSRKPRDIVKNRHNDSLKKGKLTLSQGKIKKGDDVAVDDDDDTVRTSVSQDQGTATLLYICTEEFFYKTKYIVNHIPEGLLGTRCRVDEVTWLG